jgi:ABC-2 type transport system permease protein
MNAAFGLELRRDRMLLFWLGLIAVIYAGGMTLFYPTIADSAAEFDKILAVYPKELMAAFGIKGSISDPGTFFNSYIFQFLWPLVAALGAILLGTRVAADADRGFLDLPLSTRLPRLGYLGATIVAQALGLALVATVTIGSILAVDLLIAPDFDTGRLILSGVCAFLFAIAVAGATTALAVALLDRGRAGGLAAGVLIAMYLLNVLAELSPDLRELGRISAFRYFDLQPLIDDGTFPLGASLLYLAVALLGWGLALVAFRRRDLAA